MRRRRPALVTVVALVAAVLLPQGVSAAADLFIDIDPYLVAEDEVLTTTLTAQAAGADWDVGTPQVSVEDPDGTDVAITAVTVLADDQLTFRLAEQTGPGVHRVSVVGAATTAQGAFRVLPGPSVCDAAEPLATTASGLTNVGFEGGLTAWTVGTAVDDVTVVGTDTFGTDSPTTVAPYEGGSMLRLGSSYDSEEEQQPLGRNQVCQDFVVTSPTERFVFNVFTYDYTGFDEFRYDITLQDASGQVIARYEQGAFAQGTALKTTGWRGVELDLSGRVGQTVRLTISAGGTLDDLYGFWAYVDSAENVAFPDPVPVQPIVGGNGSVMVDPSTGQTTIAFPAATIDFGELTLTYPVGCEGDDEVERVDVLLNAAVFPATINAAGTAATVVIPPDAVAAAAANGATITIQIDCPDSRQIITLGHIVLYDPSGILTDAVTGDFIEGAEVRLYRVPGWEPKTGPTDDRPNTCQSNLSKGEDDPWDQPAPTNLGVLEPSASELISPNVNPFISNAVGYYGWDVAEGCWYVTVTAEGYAPLTSPVVGVPPEVTDLDLQLNPPDTDPPVWPGGAMLTAVPSTTSVALSWPAATDASPPITYTVRRGGVVVGTTPSTSLTVTGLQPSTAYAFSVAAADAATPPNVTPTALSVSATTLAVVTPPPTVDPPTCAEAQPVPPFRDVPATFTHAAAIRCAAGLGLVLGRNGQFLPNDTLNRGQLASILLRSLEASNVTLTAQASGFPDVAGSTHEVAIRKLAAAGIIQGKSSTVFDPLGPVTRGQLMTMLDRASRELMAPYPNVPGPRFSDTRGNVHAGAIDRLNAGGVANGYADGRFGPGDTVKRGQAASFITRWLEDQSRRLD